MDKFEQRITSLEVMVPVAILVMVLNIFLLRNSGWIFAVTPTEYNECIKGLNDTNKLLDK